MDKNIYLSRGEQNIFNTLPHDRIGKTDDMADQFPQMSKIRINKINASLSSKGYLKRLKKGVYLVQDRPSEAPIISNPYLVASSLYSGYIGFSSALGIYNLLDYEPFTIYVVTKHKSQEKTLVEYTFKSVAMGKRATGMTFHEGVYVSTMAKTFFDCFYKPYYGGGYSEITKALSNANVDWDEFMKYLESGTASYCQRTGYVLDMMNKETNKIPADVIDYLKNRIKSNTKLIPTGQSRGKYDREWKVLDNLGKVKILSWWHYG